MLETTTQNYSEKELNDLTDWFHAAPIGLHIADSEGVIKRANLAELELLGYSDNPDEYIGHHLGEFFAEPDTLEQLYKGLTTQESVTEYEAMMVKRDGSLQKVLVYANAKFEKDKIEKIRTYTFPHPDDLKPHISEVGALKDFSISKRGIQLSEDEKVGLFQELEDFFVNGPVALHLVGGDGLVKKTNKKELKSMGYDQDPSQYLGQHIAKFHASQKVIDGMLGDLVGGTPLINFDATLFHQNNSELPVMIYSNSRMEDGSFINTRCFTVPVPKVRKEVKDETPIFTWPKNEELGFSVANRNKQTAKPNPMTLALKYIASRKRAEESLGFLAEISQLLGTSKSFDYMMSDVLKVSIPFFSDLIAFEVISDDGETVHSGQLNTDRLNMPGKIIDYLKNSDSKFGLKQVMATGKSVAVLDLRKEGTNGDSAYKELLDLGVISSITAPLTIRGGQLKGAVSFLRGNIDLRRNFGPAELALAEELARRLSFAVEIEGLMRKK